MEGNGLTITCGVIVKLWLFGVLVLFFLTRVPFQDKYLMSFWKCLEGELVLSFVFFVNCDETWQLKPWIM